jgi:SOS-response transcriptional repressor LexA
LARGAGVSDTTLTRLLNDPEYTGTLSPETIDRIKETYNVPGPDEYAFARARAGFAEAERTDLTARSVEIQTMTSAGRPPEITTWRLKTAALEEAGYLPGDIVVVDPNSSPKRKDVVCAQISDMQRGSTETIWRIYDPPYLVGAAHDRLAYKPLLIDHERVIVCGVVVASLRPHRLSETRQY